MVQLVDSGKLRPDSDSSCPGKLPVKLEIEDPLDEEHGPLNKRSKISAPFDQWSTGSSTISPQPAHYNPLDEPSPLGLRLRKSPSLLDLIQMRLSQGNAVSGVTTSENLELGKKKDVKCTSVSAPTDKLKASNFPASLLRIGTWECVSRYEGDLVAKCYFAKHKLVWEVLDGGLKSKIEIQWSDITALKATCPDNGPGTMDIVLARQPLFFRETNPQPRKHTLWQATSDFTGGQASIQRRHFLQCPQGLLSKHFDKLIQCDPRLNMLSQQPEIIVDNPYFESRVSVFEDQDESKSHGFDHLKSEYVSTFSGFQDAAASPSAAQSSSSLNELRDPVGRRAPEAESRGSPSPSSVMDARAIEESSSNENEELKQPRHWDQLKVPGIRPSMSVSDLVTHIGQCMQMTSSNPTGEGSWGRDMLDEITQYLLSDSQFSAASDEQSLMSRVNSLCCLLQKDAATVQDPQVKSEGVQGVEDGPGNQLKSLPESACEDKAVCDFLASEGELDDVSDRKKPPAMSRKDSVGDLLLHLPRIASMPQFLFNISEDVDNQAR
ncbi:uncharacterized protein LOC131217060 isoform X2 [Magnolia sinica]|uniref:uncharacterized protein LOC131217060 isoform X2 n=1 Tax=Magnolia sinica TaxID=86752 RepID=UPI00265A8FDE|nr:uncharacterized protein LOC131217060 isoform X2 [Magnolia sinica]